MDAKLVESGWWGGNEQYPHAAFYAFVYPQPERIEETAIHPTRARWDNALSEYILHYEDVYQSKDPDGAVLQFLESTYFQGTQLAAWDKKLIGVGKPA